MKKILFTFCLLAFLFSEGNAQFKIGGGLDFFKPSGGSSFGIGAKALNNINEQFDIAGAFHYYFEDGVTLFALDADVHYRALIVNENVTVHPLAGLNIFRSSAGSSSNTELGINIGAQLVAPVGESLELYVEPKLVVISDADGFHIAAGVYF